jgi:drug/metabolite transporter (DMT)-like permease
MSEPVTSAPGARKGALLVIFAACCWGTWSLWFRPTELPGSVTAPILFAFGAVGTIPLALREHARRPEPVVWTRRLVGMLALYALLDAVNAATFFSAMNVTTVAVAVLTHDLAPVLVALAAPRLDGTRVPGAGLAALIALAGVGLLLEPWRPGALGGDVLLGAALGLVSAVAYAANVFLGRKLTLELGSATTLGLHALGAMLLLLPLAGPELLSIEARDLPYLAIAGVFPGVLAGLAFLRGAALVGSARAAILAFLEPVVACVVGFVAFGERLGAWSVVGGVLVLAAGVLVSWPRKAASEVAGNA